MPKSHWFFLNCLLCIHGSIRSTLSCSSLLASWWTCAALSFALFHMSCVWCQPVVIDWKVQIRMDLFLGCIKTRWLAPSLGMCDPAAAQKSWQVSHRHAWFHFQPSWTIPTPPQSKTQGWIILPFFCWLFCLYIYNFPVNSSSLSANTYTNLTLISFIWVHKACLYLESYVLLKYIEASVSSVWCMLLLLPLNDEHTCYNFQRMSTTELLALNKVKCKKMIRWWRIAILQPPMVMDTFLFVPTRLQS